MMSVYFPWKYKMELIFLLSMEIFTREKKIWQEIHASNAIILYWTVVQTFQNASWQAIKIVSLMSLDVFDLSLYLKGWFIVVQSSCRWALHFRQVLNLFIKEEQRNIFSNLQTFPFQQKVSLMRPGKSPAKLWMNTEMFLPSK